MKLRQFIFIILLILLGLQFVVGQEKPQAILQDNFSVNNCCDLDARRLYFSNLLDEDKNSTGYIIIHPSFHYFRNP